MGYRGYCPQRFSLVFKKVSLMKFAKLFSSLFLFVVLIGQAWAEPGVLTNYYKSLEDGLSVGDLNHLGSLSEEQKKLAVFLVEEYQTAKTVDYVSCCSNLKNCGTALEMWSTDHDGDYPKGLDAVTPSYLLVNMSCPTTDDTAYQYELKDKVYFLKCPGNHTDLGVANPSYNGETGLRAEEVKPASPALKSFEQEPPVDQYAACVRIKETWNLDGETLTTRTQIEPFEGGYRRVWALTDNEVGTVWSSELLGLMDAYYRENSLVAQSALAERYKKLSPAAFGLVAHRYLTDDEWSESRGRLFAELRKK